MATDHTAGAPPSRGRIILVNIGCTLNSSNAEMNSVKAYSAGTSAKNADCAASFGDDGEELRSREVIGLKTVYPLADQRNPLSREGCKFWFTILKTAPQQQ